MNKPAQTTVFECSSCGASHNTSNPVMPIGWSSASGMAWCNDCTAAGIPARELAAARPLRRQRQRSAAVAA